MTSIKKRILTLLLSTFVVIWVIMMTYTWFNTQHEVEEIFDVQLAQSSDAIFGLTLHEFATDGISTFRFDLFESDLVHEYKHKLVFQVWRGQELLFASINAPSTPIASQSGYSNGVMNDELWRFLSRKDHKTGLLLLVGEDLSMRAEIQKKILLQVFWPILFVLPILTLLLVLAVNKGLQPLQRLTNEIIKRSANDLTPVSIERAPREILPVISEINQLLIKLKKAITTERQFTSDAAHELRTPLAAIKAQTQVAQRAKDRATQNHTLAKIIEGVDRSSHLVEQLLILARLEPELIYGEFEKIDLSKSLEQSIAGVSHIALEREINVSFTSDMHIVLNAIETLLDILVVNLLKNAFIYTPKGGHVDISLEAKGETVVISISDSGVGIPEALRGRIFDRFYRIPGISLDGSGLGLSIVKRIVEVHSGNIKIDDSSSGGTIFTIELPKN